MKSDILELYFCDNVDSDTWEDFLVKDQSGKLEPTYKSIESLGWKSRFALNPNGKAMFVDENGNEYRGVWFDVDMERTVAIFKKIE